MSACGSSFLALCCSVAFFFFFSLLLYASVRVVFASTYARKIGNPGPHYSTVLFISFSFFPVAVFSRSTGLRSVLFRLLVSVDFVLVQRPACHINEVTKSSFHSDSIPRIVYFRETQFYNRRGTTRHPCGIVHISPTYIREIQKFQLLLFNLKITSHEIYICKFKISFISINFHIIIIFNIYIHSWNRKNFQV